MPRVRYVPMYLNPDQLPVRPNKGLVAVEEFAVLVLQMVDLAAQVPTTRSRGPWGPSTLARALSTISSSIRSK
jgi:hypothetical protein